MRRNGWNVKVLLLSPIHDPLNVASLLMNGAGIWGRTATREGVTTKVNNAYSGKCPGQLWLTLKQIQSPRK